MGNVQVIEDVYEAFRKGDFASVSAMFDDNIEWRLAEGHPVEFDGKPWYGKTAINENLFVPLSTLWNSFSVEASSIHEAGDTVVAEARYTGNFKNTGRNLDAQVCHVWKLMNGKVVSFHQYTDTAQLQYVIGVSQDYSSDREGAL